MKSPNSLTDTELLQYADMHLQYEFDMLTWSTGILVSLVFHPNEKILFWAIKNSLLNSYALHTRNLINFLFSHSLNHDHSGDIIVEDFLEVGDIVSSYITIPPLLEEALDKANKQVAHLTLERIRYEQAGKEWKFLELNNQINEALFEIIPHIPDARMSKSLRHKLCHQGFQFPGVNIDELGTSKFGPISISLINRQP